MQEDLWHWVGDAIYILLFGMLMSNGYEIMLSLWASRTKEEEEEKPKRPYHMHPRSPEECFLCNLDQIMGAVYETSPPLAWKDVKSARGRPKTYDSEGFACMNVDCPYYKITDASMHALRRDGTRNKCEPTPVWECGCCQKKHTAWLGTPQYRLKTPSREVSRAIHMAMKGIAIADISEIMEYPTPTITRWLDRGGVHSERLHRGVFKKLRFRHLQLDEMMAKVRRGFGKLWIWTGIDAQSKLLLAWLIGNRSQADAHRFVHLVWQRLAPDCVPAFTTDGLRQYFYALTAHFGSWKAVPGVPRPVWQVAPTLLYGQLRKVRSGWFKLKAVFTKMMWGRRADMTLALEQAGQSGKIHTSFVERLNLTLRHLVAGLRRCTMALAYDAKSLRRRFALSAAYYNFCRPHASLQAQHRNGHTYLQTPAMAAGITDHVWKVREFLLHPVY
jgi:IS1 family transposase/transposase-like protein